jgi:hypothetical protein
MCVPGLAAYLRAAAVGTSDTGPDNTELTDEDRPLVSASRTTATEGRA